MKKILLFLLTLLSLNICTANKVNYFACAITTTWDGTTWDNGTPDLTTNAVFNADYTITSAFTACSVTVDNNATVTVNSDITVTIENEINVISGSYFVFENNSTLLQNNSAAINTGNIAYKRNANPMIFADYTYWGSPVSGEVLNVFSPNTRADRYHTFNANSAVNNWVYASPSSTMMPGVGYAIRAPENYTTTPQTFTGVFNGIPNNGDIPVNVDGFNPAILNYNFIANPYPSAIDVVQLIDNTNLGTLYFWTHNTTLSGNDFTTDDYAIRTRTTGTAAISGGVAPSQYIAAGQGFFASAGTTTTINFTNAMRVAGNNTQFYRSVQNNNPLNYYIHLNLTNTLGAFKQIAVGYQEDATDDYDFGTDALASTAGVIQFYSLIPTLTYRFGIQAKAYPWDIDDTIPLGINTTQSGTFDITIDHNDPFFDDKDIFLEDTLNGIFHDLKASTFTFTTAVGTFNDRFILHYKNPSLNTSTFAIESQISISNSANEISVNSNEAITSVEIFDMLGRIIFSTKNNNSNTVHIQKSVSSQPIIIKATLHNGNVVSKKYIF